MSGSVVDARSAGTGSSHRGGHSGGGGNARRASVALALALALLSIGADAALAAGPADAKCALLTKAEVEGVIGANDGGHNELGNEWGLQSCRWTATTAQKISGFPDGWRDAIEVAVFDEARTSWAREQANGEPVADFAKHAVYDKSYGQLWFDCARTRYCVVKVRTASGARREQNARHLAELVEKRLR